MATRKAYPALPAHIWWALRQKFIQSYPGRVSRDYLTSALGVGDKVAQNIHPPLKTLGLIDDENKPTDLAEAWRDDTRYADATREMIAAVYPQDLRDVSPPENPDIAAATRWFLNDTKSGSARAKQLATFYVLLAKGDPTQTTGARQGPRTSAARKDAPKQSEPRTRKDTGEAKTRTTTGSPTDNQSNGERDHTPLAPTLNLAVQVYIDKDMTPEQVDHVFASMARHIYGKE